VVARAKESGWRALDLEVEAGHQRAISLYARHQFSTSFSEQILPNSLKGAARIKLLVDRRICGWQTISQQSIAKGNDRRMSGADG
jgi:hypothetical protein